MVDTEPLGEAVARAMVQSGGAGRMSMSRRFCRRNNVSGEMRSRWKDHRVAGYCARKTTPTCDQSRLARPLLSFGRNREISDEPAFYLGLRPRIQPDLVSTSSSLIDIKVSRRVRQRQGNKHETERNVPTNAWMLLRMDSGV